MDASKRGINDGDKVKVMNDRGAMMIPVKVTPRVMPGVVAIPQGTRYTLDEKGVDQRGCINILTTTRVMDLYLARLIEGRK